MAFVLSNEVRRVGVETATAHLIGFLGANLVLGPIIMWLFPAFERQAGSEVPASIRLFVIGIGAVLLLLASRLLAEAVRKAIARDPKITVRNADRTSASEIGGKPQWTRRFI
jgi:hypothetical protein